MKSWKAWLGLGLVGLIAAIAATAGSGLLVNIWTRKEEAKAPFQRLVDVNDDIDDPAVWGRNFPIHYDDYKRTVDQVRTRYGGSEAVPHSPTAADPRSVVAQSRLEEDPRLVRLWAGYAFSKDFREERGHAFMLDDQTYTGRQGVTKQPGACINCHASAVKAFRSEGNGDLKLGFEKINAMPYDEARKLVQHPVACIDCHAPSTMELRVTRPAFVQGMARMKAKQGTEGYDVNKHASRAEMRTFVCAQCHVEYYFKGAGKQLTYPWDNGLKVENILEYYEANGHKDWIHAETGAPTLKAQHPEFEMWSQGIHARAGVTCADCHMPYKRVGAMKISDHHVRSPLLNINRACQTCHKTNEAELAARVDEIQSKTRALRDTALNALLELYDAIKRADARGTAPETLDKARALQRRAQFMLDFVEAENSSGFHAPQESVRILGEAIDAVRKGQAVFVP